MATWRRQALSQPHFLPMAVILLKSLGCSSHSTNARSSALMPAPSACAVPYPRSGGMRAGWWLCRARLCHLTWVEGETTVKQILILLPPHATHVPVRENLMPGQRLPPAWPRAMEQGPRPQFPLSLLLLCGFLCQLHLSVPLFLSAQVTHAALPNRTHGTVRPASPRTYRRLPTQLCSRQRSAHRLQAGSPRGHTVSLSGPLVLHL